MTTIYTGTNAGTYSPAYDGNGNIVAYINAENGTIVAEYEYGPFGELIRASGKMAKEFNILFSTKYYDWETGLYYYGYRYYSPIIGRWLSSDPIGENGGVNLYGFVGNNPIRRADRIGLLFDDPLAGSGDLFLMFLLHNGNSWFNGYSDLVWKGVMSNKNVIRYFDFVEASAKIIGKCCSEKKTTIQSQPLVNRGTMFGVNSGQIEAGLAIGTGNVVAGKGLLKVKCDAAVCNWTFEVTITITDKYSFHAFDENMNQMPWYTFDNNLLLRWLELTGQDFDISDSRVQERSGKFPCKK